MLCLYGECMHHYVRYHVCFSSIKLSRGRSHYVCVLYDHFLAFFFCDKSSLVRAIWRGLWRYAFITFGCKFGLAPRSQFSKLKTPPAGFACIYYCCCYCCCCSWFCICAKRALFWRLRISSIWSSGDPICKINQIISHQARFIRRYDHLHRRLSLRSTMLHSWSRMLTAL